MDEVKKIASKIRHNLKDIQVEADKENKENDTSAKARMKRIQQQTLSKVFKIDINPRSQYTEFPSVSTLFEIGLRHFS